MVGAATAEARFRSGALGALVRSLPALLTPSGLTAGGTSMAKAMTLETAKRVRNKDANILAEPSDV